MASAPGGVQSGRMMGDGMMTEVLIGSGWAGLLACMVVGTIARILLAAAERRRRAAQEQIDHAARLGAAFRGSRAASGTQPGGEAGVDDGLGARSPAAPPASADRRPGWYSSEGPDRQGLEPR